LQAVIEDLSLLIGDLPTVNFAIGKGEAVGVAHHMAEVITRRVSVIPRQPANKSQKKKNKYGYLVGCHDCDPPFVSPFFGLSDSVTDSRDSAASFSSD
jgi:hypothetical protein